MQNGTGNQISIKYIIHKAISDHLIKRDICVNMTVIALIQVMVTFFLVYFHFN